MTPNPLLCTLCALLPLSGCILPMADDDAGDTETSAGSEGGGTEPSTSDPTDTDPGSTDDGSLDSSGSDDGEDSGSDETGNPQPGHCVDASLFMGNPYFDGDFGGWNPAGQGVFDDPPLRSRHLAGLPDGRVAIETQFEVWGAENGTVHRIAGMENDSGETRYEPNGACADVRVLIAAGIAGLPNGNIVVADTRGNGLVELSDPFGDCQGAAIAGNPVLTLDSEVPGTGTAAAGDVDGPGAMALFNGVERPVSDEEGNIYVVDTGNQKFKRIAADADRTVSTVFTYEDALPMAMTAFDGMLYVSGTTTGQDFIWAIDVASGTREEIYYGGDLFEELDTGADSLFYGMTNDGVDLLLAASVGYVVRVSTSGEPIEIVAGFGLVSEYPTDLDLTMPIPLTELPIRSYAIALADLVRFGDDLLFTGNANGIGFHVWSINCG